jgi:transcriptional regulator with XRE-family HTH domain
MANPKDFYKRLTKLFRSGPSITRKIKNIDTKAMFDNDILRNNIGYRAGAPFGREASPFSVLGSYGMIDRFARYSEFVEMENCLHGDTKIAVPGGYKTIKELAEEYGLEKTFIVYSYDHSKGQIVPAVAKQARQTTVDHAYKVTFDSGKEIIGTADHRLMKRDGTYCVISDLKVGDAMMPFYRRSVASDRTEGQHNKYQTIYTVGKNDNKYGWVAEHKLLAEFLLGRKLNKDEVVHHRNFLAHDNSIENLQVMKENEHQRLHAKILNGKKWDQENNLEWIENFKKSHSQWMTENNPSERKDITFAKILQWCDENEFSFKGVVKAFDTSQTTILNRLKSKGFDNFTQFAKAYQPEWRHAGCDNSGNKNPRYNTTVSIGKIYDFYQKGFSQKELAKKLGVSITPITNRLKEVGYSSWSDFVSTYENHKVVKIEYFGVVPLYDLTVDKYKNFATDSVISHNTAEIATALNIYADEISSVDDRGRSLHIFSENSEIKKTLDELFYDIINVEFNLRPWVRNLCKFGDFFLYNEIIPEHGIINVVPIPVDQVERVEGYDPEDPYAVRFKWLTHGGKILENWQVTHFRILGNDRFLPYGSSILDPARRVWHQLGMLEDAMLVYRIVRSPERRVFYVDVANIAPNDIPSYMEGVKSQLSSKNMVEKMSGREDRRWNPVSVLEDYWVPKRGANEATKIETLPGGTNNTAIEDVEYIQRKLFSALQVPKAYLGFDEALGGKATLAQEDIRFSRTVSIFQKMVIAELNKIAMLHLYARGFDGEDLVNFEIKLSNPSSVAVQQKLDLWKNRFEIGGAAKETKLVDENWIKKNILGLTSQEMADIEIGLRRDKISEAEIETITAENLPQQQQRDVDPFDPSAYSQTSVEREPSKQIVNQPQTQGEVDYLAALNPTPKNQDGDTAPLLGSGERGQLPIGASATPILDRNKKNYQRRAGSIQNLNPDFASMLSPSNRDAEDPYDLEYLRNPLRKESITIKDLLRADLESEIRSVLKPSAIISKSMRSIFDSFDRHHKVSKVLNEEQEIDFTLTDEKSSVEQLLEEVDFEGLELSETDEMEQKIKEELENSSS